jgi:hypothetical protein
MRAAVLVMACACMPISALRTGDSRPLPDGCPVKQERAVRDGLEPVGVICQATSSVDPRLDSMASLDRTALEDHVCLLGGSVIIASALCTVDRASGVEWRVYRERLSEQDETR